MIPEFIKRLFRRKAKSAPVPGKLPPPTDEDYANAVCRHIFNSPGSGLVTANTDEEGNIHFSDGTILLVDDIPRNDNRL